MTTAEKTTATGSVASGGGTSISATEGAKRLRAGKAVLIDVRTPAEFRELHAAGAINHPLDSLSPLEVAQQHAAAGQELLLICRSGNRSATAHSQFLREGIEHAVSVEGGTQSWEREGLPVERGRKTLALDRQMRILAGSLVVLGVAIGWFVYPLGYVLAAFIGAGLVFAGVSDSCPMSQMLAKMPWNR